jgi:hypothetical protein
VSSFLSAPASLYTTRPWSENPKLISTGMRSRNRITHRNSCLCTDPSTCEDDDSLRTVHGVCDPLQLVTVAWLNVMNHRVDDGGHERSMYQLRELLEKEKADTKRLGEADLFIPGEVKFPPPPLPPPACWPFGMEARAPVPRRDSPWRSIPL